MFAEMMVGALKMQEWCVENLDSQQKVALSYF